MVFNSHLRQSFDCIPRVAGDIESEWALFHAAIVEAAAMSCGHEAAGASRGSNCCQAEEEAAEGYWQAKRYAARAVAEAKTRVWEEFGVAMEKDFWRGRRQLAQTVYSGGGELLTSTGQIVGRWKEYFEDLLNPTDMHSPEETEPGGSEVGALISGVEVAEADPEVDEIRPGATGVEWQTGVMVPIFNKGTRGYVPTIGGSHSSASLGRSTLGYWRGESDRLLNLGFRRNNVVFVLVVEQWTSSLPLAGCWKGHGSLPNQAFVDLEKAYDLVPRGTLHSPLQEYGVDGPLLRAIQSLYCRSVSLVRIAGSKSDLFPVGVGLLPGLLFVTGSVHNIYGQDF
ncbi:hypothetical protein L3Q82_012336 [Scortum barcoo]|uniref:Uncharacterized protein n=1 Tax=Scortum barcoo TaxID=214431 RepID=A0ACB8W2M9_9TELE|nr:hypothetical protein L3Q82_012336 [Scortum barcoo]